MVGKKADGKKISTLVTFIPGFIDLHFDNHLHNWIRDFTRLLDCGSFFFWIFQVSKGFDASTDSLNCV